MFNAFGRLLLFFSVFTEITLNGLFRRSFSQFRSSLPNFIHGFDQIEKEIDDLLVKDMTSFPMEFHQFAVGVFDLTARRRSTTLSSKATDFSDQ